MFAITVGGYYVMVRAAAAGDGMPLLLDGPLLIIVLSAITSDGWAGFFDC
jgi:hypothetical protein